VDTTTYVVRVRVRVRARVRVRTRVLLEVQNSLYKIQGVKDLHDLRVWSLSLNNMALSVHVAIGNLHMIDYAVVNKICLKQNKTNVYILYGPFYCYLRKKS
jgi:Co/Zn/Cd efflux system component